MDTRGLDLHKREDSCALVTMTAPWRSSGFGRRTGSRRSSGWCGRAELGGEAPDRSTLPRGARSASRWSRSRVAWRGVLVGDVARPTAVRASQLMAAGESRERVSAVHSFPSPKCAEAEVPQSRARTEG